MGNSEETKELIIRETIKLIQEMNGNVEQITIRKIAERSGVGVGLINHYFESKKTLLETCVQKVISGVIVSFKPQLDESQSRRTIIYSVACQVMDFLMENQQISRMSILADMNNPRNTDNTMETVRGFAASLSGTNSTLQDLEDAFLLTAILQESFLRKDVLINAIGINFYNKIERDEYIKRSIMKLMNWGDEI